MAALEKRLEIVPASGFDAAARDAYALALRHDPTDGLASLDEVLAGSIPFEVRYSGMVVLRFALRVRDRAHGSEGLVVAAAGGLPGVDLTAEVLPAIERMFSGVRRVTFETTRKGLVGKALAQGYHVAYYGVSKTLDH